MFSIDHIGPIQEEIDKKILIERERYSEIYRLVEQYVSKYAVKDQECIILGGNIGINLLLKKPRNIWDFTYTLYSEKSFTHANNLTNLIEEKLKEKYPNWHTFLKTKISNRKYQIFVDQRPMIEFIGLQAEGSTIYDLILPVEVQSFDKSLKFYALPIVFHLMDMYRTLYSPAIASEWEQTMEYEEKITESLSDKQIKGAAERKFILIPKKREQINNAILKDFIVDNKDFVLIGEYALRLLVNEPIENYILQVIHASSHEILSNKELMNKILGSLSMIIKNVLGRDISVSYSTRNLKVMQDTRLSRIAIRVGPENEQREIMYIYNIHYDLIPFNKMYMRKGNPYIQVGDPFVIMRFLLIEIWVVRGTLSIGKIDASFAEERLESLTAKFLKLRGMMQNVKHDGMKVFSKTYAGIYEDEIMAQKKTMQRGKHFPDYDPRDFLEKFGKYRSLQESAADDKK